MADDMVKRLKEMMDNDEPEVYSDIDRFFDIFLEMSVGIENSIFLKGNVLLNKILPNSARMTKDLDFGVLNSTIFNDVIKPRFTTLGDAYVEKGLCDKYAIKEMIDSNIGSITMYKSKEVVFNIDVGNTKNLYCGVVEYTFDDKDKVLGSSIPKIVCDKLKAILSTRRLRRKKDLYDIFIINAAGLWPSMREVYSLMVESTPISVLVDLLSNYPFTEKEVQDLKGDWGSFQVLSTTGVALDKPEFKDIYPILTTSFYDLKLLHDRGEIHEFS